MSDPVRLIVWAMPRTCSSILIKSLDNIPNSLVFFELFATAFYRGQDRIGTPIYFDEAAEREIERDSSGRLKDQGSGFSDSFCSFKWVKQQLEANYPGKRVIIAKEIAHYINTRYDSIPSGYRHVFLIRNPYRMFPSWKKLHHELLVQDKDRHLSLEDFALDQLSQELVPPGLAYKEIFDLLQYVKENNLDPDPTIIDSDELVRNPAEVLSAVCGKVGIPYSDSLLSWEEGTECLRDWFVASHMIHYIDNTAMFQNFRKSTHFIQPGAVSEVPGLETFSPDLQRCIKKSMPLYLEMYEQRLKC